MRARARILPRGARRTPGGCVHTAPAAARRGAQRSPRIDLGTLGHLLPGQGHNASLRRGKHNGPHSMGHAQDLVHAARARIPPDGERPGGLCALTPAPTAEQRSPQAGLGALAPAIRARPHNESQTGASAADHTEQHTHKRIPRARSDSAQWGRPRGAVRTHRPPIPAHGPHEPAQEERTARGLQPGPELRAGRRSYPLMHPCWAPLVRPRAFQARSMPPSVSLPLGPQSRAPVGAPGAQLLRRGTGGLRTEGTL